MMHCIALRTLTFIQTIALHTDLANAGIDPKIWSSALERELRVNKPLA